MPSSRSRGTATSRSTPSSSAVRRLPTSSSSAITGSALDCAPTSGCETRDARRARSPCRVEVGTDLADVFDVKDGRADHGAVPATWTDGGVRLGDVSGAHAGIVRATPAASMVPLGHLHVGGRSRPARRMVGVPRMVSCARGRRGRARLPVRRHAGARTAEHRAGGLAGAPTHAAHRRSGSRAGRSEGRSTTWGRCASSILRTGASRSSPRARHGS